jgi:MFS family permease
LGKRFYAYVTAQAISGLGSHIGRLALAFMVFDLTHSPLALGTLLLASSITETVVRLFGAPLLDRISRLRLMSLLDLGRFAVYLLPWALWLIGKPAIGLLYFFAMITGSAAGLYSPAAMAVIPSLVPQEKLARANGLISSIWTVLGLLGPGLGALVCNLLGNANSLLMDGISYGLCGLVLFSLGADQISRSGGWGARTYLRELTEGFAFFREVPAILLITGILAFSNVGSSGSMTALLPFVRENLGGSDLLYGSISTALSIGALVGSFLVSALKLKNYRRYVMLGALLLIQLAQVGTSLLAPRLALLILPLWVLFGIGSVTYSLLSTSIYQEMVPDRLLGRAMSARMLLGQGAQPLGYFIGGAVAEHWGASRALLLGGSLPMIVTVCAFFLPALSLIDRPIPRAGEDHAPA